MKLNLFQSLLIYITILVGFGLLFSSFLVQAGDRHHYNETTVNNYSLEAVDMTGQAALFAADQIHPSENISGLQLGFGAAQHKNDYGFAAGAALNVKGWGLLNGSVAKEPESDPFIGIGINLSLGP